MTGTRPVQWVLSESDGESGFRWGYSEDGIIAEWEGVLTLSASRNGELRALQPAPGASPDRVEKTRRGAATAFLRARRHEYSLHASGVALDGKALICLGGSGLGKSTMAERMCRDARVELLADDTLGIGQLRDESLVVLPSEAAVWLAANESLDKTPVKSLRVARSPTRLRWITCLVFDDSAGTVELSTLRGAEAASALLPNLIRFEFTARAEDLDFIAQMLKQCPVIRVARSRNVPAEAVSAALLTMLVEEGG